MAVKINFIKYGLISLVNFALVYKYFNINNKYNNIYRGVFLTFSSLMFINYVILAISRYIYERNIKNR